MFNKKQRLETTSQREQVTFMTKANYIGLTIKVEQHIPKEWNRYGKLMNSLLKYKVTAQYIDYIESIVPFKLMSGKVEDIFEVKEKEWIFDSPTEAMAKFERIRNQVRRLGKFRNLNKAVIPDYRDKP